MGLLVARCVLPGRGGPRGTGGIPASSRKVSMREFEAEAGVDRDTLAATSRPGTEAAEAGIVPPHFSLEPGVDPELDYDRLPPWEDYSRAAPQKHPLTERR